MKDHLIRPTTRNQQQRGEIFNTSRERFVDFPLLQAKRGILVTSRDKKKYNLRGTNERVYIFPRKGSSQSPLHFSLAKNDKDSRDIHP